jgi:hypothetical protein
MIRTPTSIRLTRILQVERRGGAPVDFRTMLARIEGGLAGEGARSVVRTDNAVHFKGGILSWAPGRTLLTAITSGTVQVASDSKRTEITYRLDFVHLFAMSAVLAVGLGVAVRASGGWGLPTWALGLLVAACWAWMVWTNCTIALWRFGRFVRRILRD